MRWLRPSRPEVSSPPAVRLPGMSPSEFEAYQLYLLAESGATRLRLWTPRGPAAPPDCRRAHGTEMSVDDAMRQAPIPHEVPEGRTCECLYRPASSPRRPRPRRRTGRRA